MIPAFLAMVTMPFAYSISHGIAVGFIVYPLLKLFTGRQDETNALSWVLLVIFVLYFIFLN